MVILNLLAGAVCFIAVITQSPWFMFFPLIGLWAASMAAGMSLERWLRNKEEDDNG